MIVDFIGWSGLPIYKKDILFSYILCIEYIPILIRRPQKEPRRGNFEVRHGTKMDFWELRIYALCPQPKAGKWWNFCLGIKSIYGYMTQKRIFWSTNIFSLANMNKYIKHLASNRFQSKQCWPNAFFSWPLDFRWLAIVLNVDRTPWRGKEKKWWQPIELNKSITSSKPIRSDGSKLILEVS